MIVWEFIDTCEGGIRNRGYFPGLRIASTLDALNVRFNALNDKLKRSGVTVAGGIDLNRLSAAEVAGLPETLQKKITPYLGLHGFAAAKALFSRPLVLTDAECGVLMSSKRLAFLQVVRREFNKRSAVTFDDIPDGPATALMSLAWQYGDPWQDEKCGDVWSIACAGDWLGLADYLDDGFPDRRFDKRRRKEAEFVRQYASVYGGQERASA